MAFLVTVERARKALRLSPSIDDPELTLMVEEASDIIRAFVDRPGDANWTADVANWDIAGGGSPVLPVPAIIQRATLLQVADLYTHRGDEGRHGPEGGIAPEAEALLRATGYRDPILA